MNLDHISANQILLLDGGLGTMIQKNNLSEADFRGREFLYHPVSLSGFNDILNITKPSLIKEIHTEYLKSGANIITTNTFNSNPISMQDYGLNKVPGLVERLNKEGAKLAKEVVRKFEIENGQGICLVGGSIGPTNRMLSMSPDISNPLLRNISYDELKAAYQQQVRGLIAGGIDILICETFFDTLNLKCALDAANTEFSIHEISLPILVSATISNADGRLLSGQNLEAFVTSVTEFKNVKIIGLNCGFGPDKMQKGLREINRVNYHFTSCHPNAGMPDELGCYKLSPEEFCRELKAIIEEKGSGLNIVGGCCGTTPEFIKELKKSILTVSPRKIPEMPKNLHLSGLEILNVDEFIVIGERCNVAGSRKFLRLIQEKKYEEAAEIAKSQIKQGARVIDLNMDDALLNVKEEMVNFIRYILAEPDIARVPFMIDSSKWDVIEAALKEIQGKGIVNSLSLKEGEETFIEKARRVRELGFALVVMAFDEKGQGDTYQRKIEIARRAYNLLINKCGFEPHDIIFDVNVMTVATGMKEHSRYALDFLDAVKWIKDNLPGALTSGGISNLSFAFRGKNKIREMMHSVFLHHACKAGLDMAIVNPSTSLNYDEIPSEIRSIIEDIVFDRDDQAVEKLIEIASGEDTTEKKTQNSSTLKKEDENLIEILKRDIIEGDLSHLQEHVEKALTEIKEPIKLIEGPLLEGMKKVGDLFGEGKMFLPQVLKTSRAMKRAVEILTPYIEKDQKTKKNSSEAGKVLIATVKGDVHDIGKNIVATVLGCNNFNVVDLGIMVSPEKILEAISSENPDFICLSGLITPSLSEMINTVRLLEKENIKIPVMVGGAATSLKHTALKISPEYSGPILYMKDASQNPIAANKLLNPNEKDAFESSLKEQYKAIISENSWQSNLLPFDEILNIVEKEKRNEFKSQFKDLPIGEIIKIRIPLREVIPLISWKMFFHAWKLHGKLINDIPDIKSEQKLKDWVDNLNEEDKVKGEEILKLYFTAESFINHFLNEAEYSPEAIIRFESARSDIKNIYIKDKCFPMLRQQRKDTNYLSLSDYISRQEDLVVLFGVTSGEELMKEAGNYLSKGDEYHSMVIQTLADRIVEASAEWLQNFISNHYIKISIRPAWGYPMLPDQLMIHETQEFLPLKEIGIHLTENGAMYPQASISGLMIAKPEAKYFMVGELGTDQIKDYAERRGISLQRMMEILGIDFK